MCDNVNSNPFAGLFSTINDAVSYSSQNQALSSEKDNAEHVEDSEKVENHGITEISETDQDVDELIEDVFGLTLHLHEESNLKKPLVFVDTDSIEHALFDRLMLPDPQSKLILNKNTKDIKVDEHVIQTQSIRYLFTSYCRLQQYRPNKKLSKTIEELSQIILRNVATAFQEPELFEGQEVHNQFVTLFEESIIADPEWTSFVNGIVTELSSTEDNTKEDAIAISFTPILDVIHKKLEQCNLFNYEKAWIHLLSLFASIETLAKLVIYHSTPSGNLGRAYADTLFGAFLNLSCLPKSENGSYDFFDKPFQLSVSNVEGQIRTALEILNDELHKMFHMLLKCSPTTRHLTLQWIGDCLHANANRGKLWNSHNNIVGLGPALCVSDGFMLNLAEVLLRLSIPFCIKPGDNKVPKIDPTYCAAEAKDEEESKTRGLHLKGMTTETCLIPTLEGQTRPVAKTYGFITECFFLTHRALDLGYRVVMDKLMRVDQNLGRIQQVYNDARSGGSSEVLEVITQRMEMEMSKYLSLKTSLLQMTWVSVFHATTAFWLVQVNLSNIEVHEGEEHDYAPKQCLNVTFPLPEIVPDTLRCIPEFIVENTIGFLCFMRRFNPNTFEHQKSDFLNPILTEIIVLMESQDRLYNPHLRARLAEGLEALLPTTETYDNSTNMIGLFYRQQLFVAHPHRQQIVPNLLRVFVSIEMTGQNVQFEQKFNYRRPMYSVMEYLWKIPEHRNIFVSLAKEAEANMESVQPALFLRFINLLMNDAVFLLDEALSNMAQLRQMLHARESGEWNKLPQHERDQQASYLRHIGMIARFDNILGRKTIQTLKMLTSEIKSIFCHSTMVDRIASMLNYLLLQLVGPNKKNLKVNDQKEYAFNPANLVLNICEIYINLSKNESFTLAVSQDGRSYSPELFKLADSVLVRIGGVNILGELDEFAKRVEETAHQKKEEDEILVDAPDEFLDPIMSTLMMDPVILPSSKVTIDRQTIARHLLSDQTDPFNRSPLTMDMIKPNTELQQKIREWVSEKKQERAQNK